MAFVLIRRDVDVGLKISFAGFALECLSLT